MVNIRCGASDRICVPARPAQHVHRRVSHMRRRTRRSASTIGGGAPDMTIGRAAADQAGARPYLRRYAGNAFQTSDASAGPYRERIHVDGGAPSTCNAPYLINCPRYSLVSYTKVTLPSFCLPAKKLRTLLFIRLSR